jgi:hypothetical protein
MYTPTSHNWVENMEKQKFQKDKSVKKVISDENVLVKMGNYSFYADPETAKMVKEGFSILEEYLSKKPNKN